MTARLNTAITGRLSGADLSEWLAARTGLDAALAETVALAADDVLLDDLLARLADVPGAAGLLLGVSVYREAADRNAVLFQAGQADPDAEQIPDRQAAYQQITAVLAAAGITIDESFDPPSVPGDVRAQLAPYFAELNRRPVPPYRAASGLPGQIAACQAASLLTISGDGQEPWFFVHRWTATELATRATRESGQRLAGAHRRAAGYWQWRVQVWPQDKAADVHDLLEARHHLLQAGDTEEAGQVTEAICLQMDTWGAWEQEAALIHDTLARLPPGSPRRAAYLHHLGILAQARGDYEEAARQYQRSLDIKERLGDQAGMATSYHNLGILAHDRGDYEEAARQYQRSLDTKERLGDQAGMATSYHNLGILAHDRGDYEEAARQYQRALDIDERLGDQAGMAASYHISAASPTTAGTMTRPPASTSAPSTSTSGSATRPAWPAATTSSAASPRTAGTMRRPPASTSAPSTSSSGSTTRPAWPPATASSASSPRTQTATAQPLRSSPGMSRRCRSGSSLASRTP